MLNDLFSQLHFAHIFSGALLFLAGIYIAPIVVDKNIKWLLIYPRWVARLMERYFSQRWGFLSLFLIILLLNNFSLFLGFISGFLVILPFLLAFLTGFHVAVVGYDMLGWQGIWHLLVNPVAWLEFPAAWISFGMGIKISSTLISTGDLGIALQHFEQMLPLYLKYVFVLLVLAGILESVLIIWAEKYKDNFK